MLRMALPHSSQDLGLWAATIRDLRLIGKPSVCFWALAQANALFLSNKLDCNANCSLVRSTIKSVGLIVD